MNAINPTAPILVTISGRRVRRYLIPTTASVLIALLSFALLDWISFEYAYIATYTILQYVVLATA